MKLLYIADNGFFCYKGRFYCTRPNYINLQQYKKYFSKISVIARKNLYQENGYIVENDIKVHLIMKNNFISLFREMIKFKDDYDIILMRNGINGCVASVYASFLNKQTIAYCGSDPYEFYCSRNSIFSKMIAVIWRFLEKMKMKNATYAQYCTEYLYRRYPTSSPFLICSNVEIDILDSDFERRMKKINDFNKNKVIVGMIGRLDENKGVRTVIYALEELGENFIFEFLGSGNPDIFEYDISKCGVRNRLHFLGYWNDKQKIKEWLHKIDIYIQPSLSEGLPRSIIEAMSVACPCIATNIAGLPDVLNSQYLINPKDYHALAYKIKYLSEHKDAAIFAAFENFEKAKEYDKRIRDKKLDDFFFDVIQNKVSRRVL